MIWPLANAMGSFTDVGTRGGLRSPDWTGGFSAGSPISANSKTIKTPDLWLVLIAFITLGVKKIFYFIFSKLFPFSLFMCST